MTIAASGSSRLVFRAAIGLVATAITSCVPTAPYAPGDYNGVCPTCLPDPGWALKDCDAAEAGLEFFSPAIVNFDDPNAAGLGRFLYGYTDGTSSTTATAGYQPQAVAADRCMHVSGNHAFHLTGGPFQGWGGGIGVAMEHLSQDALPDGSILCPQMLGTVANPACYPYSPDTLGQTLSAAALDMSQWEGISVWARRSPSSQPLLRMLVGNKDTDDDINFLMQAADQQYGTKTPHYCERVKECICPFQDTTCNHFDMNDPILPPAYISLTDGAWFCDSPGATPSYSDMAPATSFNNTCNTTRCNDPYPAYATITDTQFYGKQCTPYRTRNGILSSFCYDPATDPPPASGDQQCGDFFTFPLHLTTEWQLFLVPFSTMYQQGWAKKAAYFDLHTISVARLTWDAGYIDYWIDDMRFYRHKQPSSP